MPFKFEKQDAFSGSMFSSNTYNYFSFGLLNVSKGDDKLSICGGLKSCREDLIGTLRSEILRGSTFPTDKTRICFAWHAAKPGSTYLNEAERWCERAKATLNAFDRLAGWPLTRVYPITEIPQDRKRAYYFLSSRRWIKSAYLLSLYVLLVRASSNDIFSGFKNFDELEEKLSKGLGQSKTAQDKNYLLNSLPFWRAIMLGYPKIFRQKKIAYYWNEERFGDDKPIRTSADGLDRLVTGRTSYKEAYRQLMAVKKELDSKK